MLRRLLSQYHVKRQEFSWPKTGIRRFNMLGVDGVLLGNVLFPSALTAPLLTQCEVRPRN